MSNDGTMTESDTDCDHDSELQENMSSHNKTRAEKRAAGLRELSVWLCPEDRDAIRAEARELGMPEPKLVGEWAKSLAKAQARRNRQPDPK